LWAVRSAPTTSVMTATAYKPHHNIAGPGSRWALHFNFHQRPSLSFFKIIKND
jgi:hypothetical protein